MMDLPATGTITFAVQDVRGRFTSLTLTIEQAETLIAGLQRRVAQVEDAVEVVRAPLQ